MLLFGPQTRPSRRVTEAGSSCSSLAPMRLARSTMLSQAVPTAPPAITIEREPQVPVE